MVASALLKVMASLAGTVACTWTATADAPAARDPQGLVLVVGMAGPEVVPASVAGLMLVQDDDAAAQARRRVDAAGAGGRVQVGVLADWPLAGWPVRLADRVVIAQEALVAGHEADVVRLLADHGTLTGGNATAWNRLGLRAAGQSFVKPPTPGLAPWPMLQCDLARSSASPDSEAGPAQVPRWIAGPILGEYPVIADGGLLLSIAQPSDAAKYSSAPVIRGPAVVTARRAHNGTMVWTAAVDLWQPATAYWGNRAMLVGRTLVTDTLGLQAGFVSDGRRLYVREAQRIRILALADGTAVGALPAVEARWLAPLGDGELLVTEAGRMRRVDASGALRWQVAQEFRWPAVAAGIVVATRHVEDQAVELVGLRLDDGAIAWTVDLVGVPGPVLRGILGGQALLTTYAANGLEQPDRAARSAGRAGLRAYRLGDGGLTWREDLPDDVVAPHLVYRQLLWHDGRIHGRCGGTGPARTVGEHLVLYGIKSINTQCQHAVSTPNWLIFKDHGGIAAGNGLHVVRPGGYSLGKTGCGFMAALPAYGLTFLSSQNCNCQIAGQWLRAGAPIAAHDPMLLRLPERLRVEDRRAPPDPPGDERSARHPVRRGSASAVEVLARHPAATGWGQLFGGADRLASVDRPAPAGLTPCWSARPVLASPSDYLPLVIGGDRLTAPMLAENLVVTADVEGGAILAFDAATGVQRWRVQTDARIPAAPVLHRGLVLAATEAGQVWCLEAGGGAICWRARIAPDARFMASHGRFASQWPVNAPLLACDDQVVAVAGHSFAWGTGTRVVAVELADGRVRWAKDANLNPGLLALRGGRIEIMHEIPADHHWFGVRYHGSLDPRSGEGGPAGAFSGAQAIWRGDARRNQYVRVFAIQNRHGVLRAFGDRFGIEAAFGGARFPRAPQYAGESGPLPGPVRAVIAGPDWLLFGGGRPDGTGYLLLARRSGQTWSLLAPMPIASPPAWQGMALAEDTLVVSRQDGAVQAFALVP